MVVAPLLFQTAFNYAFYPPVAGRSSRLYELAPMGSRRFTKSPGTSPPGGSSFDRICVVSGPLPRLSPYRIAPVHLALGGGNFLSWLAPTVGRPPSPDNRPNGGAVKRPSADGVAGGPPSPVAQGRGKGFRPRPFMHIVFRSRRRICGCSGSPDPRCRFSARCNRALCRRRSWNPNTRGNCRTPGR